MNLLPKKAKLSADRLQLQGRDMKSISEAEFARLRGDRISMIFQDPMTSLNPVYRVGDQLQEVYTHHGKGGRKEAAERAEYLLEKVGISAPKSRLIQYPHQLSGGLRQRIMIAMTLMCDPALIIADEPTTALDVTIQAQILNTLRNLQKEFKTAMILITHDLGVVARVADKVAVMYAGKFVETGTAMEVFQQPTHPYTQGLMACIPTPGNTGHGRLGSIPGIVPSLVGEMEGCLFRNRCASVRAECEKGAEIPMKMLGEGRGYRCVMSVEECMKRAQVEILSEAS
jgi:peptide/nickel transport system ATP-binding protein